MDERLLGRAGACNARREVQRGVLQCKKRSAVGSILVLGPDSSHYSKGSFCARNGPGVKDERDALSDLTFHSLARLHCYAVRILD